MAVSSRERSLTVLLPPSEGKADGGDGHGWNVDDGSFGPLLADQRDAVVRSVADLGGGDSKLLGVTGRHLDRAQGANLTLVGSPTLPAWRRYTGVVWDHLDPATLPAAARRRIIVVSGLLGLVRADDPVPDYRLKMSSSVPPLAKLSTWWRPALTDALEAAARRRFVVDLLPNEHRAALDTTRLGGVSVVFRERSGGSGGHAAKAAKGRLARHLLTHAGPPIDALHSWHDDRFVIEIGELTR